MKSSMRVKIIVTNLIVLLLAFLVVSVVTVLRLGDANQQMLIKNLSKQAELSAGTVNLTFSKDRSTGAFRDSYTKIFEKNAEDLAFQLARDSGKRVLLFNTKSKTPIAYSEDSIEQFSGYTENDLKEQDFKELDTVYQNKCAYVVRNVGGSRYMYFSFPVDVNGELVGKVMFIQPFPLIDEDTSRVLIILALSFLIGIFVVMAFSVLMSVRITRPIMQLKGMAVEISKGNFTNKIPVNTTDEVGELGSAFNSMMGEIENRINLINIEKGKLNSILESMGEGVIALNKKRETIAINTKARSLVDDSLMAEIQGVVKKVMREKARTVMELSSNDKSFLVCGTPLDIEGGDGGIVLLVNDVTELRLLKDKQRQFVTNVSHELKTPLTTILGYIDLLKDKGHDKEIFDKSVYYLQDAGERLLRLISDLIDLSSLSKYEFEIEPKSTNISKLVKDIVGQMSLKAQKFNIKINTYIADIEDILVDPARIKQAVVNMLDNAIKNSPDGEISVILCDEDSVVRLIIEDNGCGIPTDVMERIFEPFYRVDKARSRTLGGNGLGLSITKEIIERHNGQIKIESKEGQGTKVSIILPK
jgi:signal transduction histidine kinase